MDWKAFAPGFALLLDAHQNISKTENNLEGKNCRVTAKFLACRKILLPIILPTQAEQILEETDGREGPCSAAAIYGNRPRQVT